MGPDQNERLRLKAEVFKAIRHPLRLRGIEFPREEEQSVCDIVNHCGMSISTISKYLSILKKVGKTTDRRDGRKNVYTWTMTCALDFTQCVEGTVIKRLGNQCSAIAG